MSRAPLCYFDVDIEWGHLRFGPLLIHWFNSSAEHDSWGSCDITWDLKYSFLFYFNEMEERFDFNFRIIDPDIARVLKGAKHF
jgi:hypothetical protein